MVSASLRQNGGRAPEQNPFTPGKTPKGWTETRTRESGHDQWPHPENPGLIADSLGYYDWAGRRLFLSDGSPDPETPGAYRYQTRPDLCDPHATDDDPASPRYEPAHLRHKPGDEWMIGGKAYDPDDPGPFGSPGWRPDRRTGRHRRGERPDPIPPWEWQSGDPEPPDFARTRIEWDAYGNWSPERISRSGRPEDGAGQVPDRDDPDGSDGETDPDSDFSNDHDDLPRPGSDGDSGWNSGSGTGIGFRWTPRPAGQGSPSAAGWPSPGREAEGRSFWTTGEDEKTAATRSATTGVASAPLTGPAGLAAAASASAPLIGSGGVTAAASASAPFAESGDLSATSSAAAPVAGSGGVAGAGSSDAASIDSACAIASSEPEAPHAFTRMQEEAFRCFMNYSTELAAAHLAPAAPYFRERIVWILHWLLWVATVGFISTPRPLASGSSPVPQSFGVTSARTRNRREGPAQSGQASSLDTPPPSQPVRPGESSSRASSSPVESGSRSRFLGTDEVITGRPSPSGFAAARFAAGAAAGRAAAGARRFTRGPDASRAFQSSTLHGRPRPRPVPSPTAYASRWEKAFDSQTIYSGALL
jgi:hypothetical protein